MCARDDQALSLADYREWRALAGRIAFRPDEAEDLLHDVLLAAVTAGRADLTVASNRAWLRGALNKRARHLARSAARRLKRETRSAADGSRNVTCSETSELSAEIAKLPPSARSVATLALHGMTRAEIVYALDITPTAFRQRLTTIRKAIGGLSIGESKRGAPNVHPDSGHLRRALLELLKRHGSIGTHDPDGHLLAFSYDRRSQPAGHRQHIDGADLRKSDRNFTCSKNRGSARSSSWSRT